MFKDKDVICFLGDSITAGGFWMAEVYQTLRKKYKVKCYNVGVSGGRVSMAEKHLYSSCLSYNPDYVTVMFGMNDVSHEEYKEQYKDLTDEELQKKAIEIYKESYERVIKKIIDFGAKPIICTTTPYDDISEIPAEKNTQKQGKLDICIEIAKSIAQKYDCQIVDFKSVMRPMLKDRKLIRDDRTHPTEEGHHIMAQVFLYEIGEIDKPDFDTPFEFEEWNKKRFDREQELVRYNFVEYCMFIDKWEKGVPAEEKKKATMEMYENCEDKTTFFAKAVGEYPNILDTKELIKEDIVRLTI